MRRFVFYERPQNLAAHEACSLELGISNEAADDPAYASVGELYALILSGFERISPVALFVGDPDAQVGSDLVDFPDIIKVTGLESAQEAINLIVEQGEGNPADPVNSHFGAFTQVLREFESEIAQCESIGRTFEPSRRAVSNPVVRLRGDYGSDADVPISLLQDRFTASVSELFDEIYMLMLRMLQFVFNNSTASPDVLRWFAQTAIRIMPIGHQAARRSVDAAAERTRRRRDGRSLVCDVQARAAASAVRHCATCCAGTPERAGSDGRGAGRC